MSDIVQRQRQGWAAAAAAAAQGKIAEPIFGPAAAAQARSNPSGVLFSWTPILIPYEYTNWVEEAQSYTKTAYIGDWSAINKLSIQGPQALSFLSWLGVNDLSRFDIGQIKHHVQVDERGKVASEGVLFRTGDDAFIYTGGNGDWVLYQFGKDQWDAQITDLTPDLFVFEVQGPASFHVMQKVTGDDLRDIGFNRTRMSRIGEMPVRVLRTGITGELGYELHGSAEYANAVWTAVVEAGRDLGIRELGCRAQIISHIEAGIATNGLDYLSSSIGTPGQAKIAPSGRPSGSFIPYNGLADFLRSPAELGWGGRGRADGDFFGSEALKQEAQAGGPARRLVGLEWNSEDVKKVYAELFEAGDQLTTPMDLPRAFGSYDQVLNGGQLVGVSTSRVYSVHLRRMISLAVVDRDLCKAGTPLEVLWGDSGTKQHRIRACVSQLPFKPDRRRTDVSAFSINGADHAAL